MTHKHKMTRYRQSINVQILLEVGLNKMNIIRAECYSIFASFGKRNMVNIGTFTVRYQAARQRNAPRSLSTSTCVSSSCDIQELSSSTITAVNLYLHKFYKN